MSPASMRHHEATESLTHRPASFLEVKPGFPSVSFGFLNGLFQTGHLKAIGIPRQFSMTGWATGLSPGPRLIVATTPLFFGVSDDILYVDSWMSRPLQE